MYRMTTSSVQEAQQCECISRASWRCKMTTVSRHSRAASAFGAL
jgi:hypothetical protein